MLDGFGFVGWGLSPFGGVENSPELTTTLSGDSGWSATASVKRQATVTLIGSSDSSVDAFGIIIKAGSFRHIRTPARPTERRVPQARLPGHYNIGKHKDKDKDHDK